MSSLVLRRSSGKLLLCCHHHPSLMVGRNSNSTIGRAITTTATTNNNSIIINVDDDDLDQGRQGGQRQPQQQIGRYVRCFSDQPLKAQRKVKKKAKKSAAKGEPGGRSRELDIMLSALDAPTSKPPPPANEEEEQRREKILKDYTIGKFQEHNAQKHELACKLRLKRHAMKMLPRNSYLKEKALEVDDVGPPKWRRIPTYTPPIPGFNPNDYTTTEE